MLVAKAIQRSILDSQSSNQIRKRNRYQYQAISCTAISCQICKLRIATIGQTKIKYITPIRQRIRFCYALIGY